MNVPNNNCLINESISIKYFIVTWNIIKYNFKIIGPELQLSNDLRNLKPDFALQAELYWPVYRCT